MDFRRINGFKLEQGNHRIFVCVLSGEDIAELDNAGHLQVDVWNSADGKGYQRAPRETRFKKVAEYLRGKSGISKPLMPQALILNSRNGVSFSPMAGSDGNYGHIEFTRDSFPLYEVDGQHRIGGILRAIEDVEGDNRVAQMQFPIVIMDAFDQMEEAMHFYIINFEQKGVPTALAQQLLTKQGANDEFMKFLAKMNLSWKVVATKIVNQLSKTPGPWQDRIKLANTKNRMAVAAQASFVTSLKWMLNQEAFKAIDIDEKVAYVNNYWMAISELLPGCFESPKQYCLQKPIPGMFALHEIMPRVFFLADYRNDVESLVDILSNVFEEEANEDWWRKGGDGGAAIGGRGGAHQLATRFLDRLT